MEKSLCPNNLYVKHCMTNTAFYVEMLSPASGHAVLRQGNGGVSLYVQNYLVSLEIQP
jgi:hypothetical protein